MVLNIFSSALFTALSNGKVSAIISFLRTFVLLVAFHLLLPLLWGVNGIWLAIPLAELVGVVISLLCQSDAEVESKKHMTVFLIQIRRWNVTLSGQQK